MRKIEYEDFYEVDSKDFQKIINEILKKKFLKCEECNFCVEMPVKKTELHLLSINTDDFRKRKRIKIKYKKNGYRIFYEEKSYNQKFRKENSIELFNMNDICELTQKNDFKIALIKTSLKWPCIDYIAGKKFYIKAEICCAVDIMNSVEVSKPFFYLEIESTNANDLNMFYKTNLSNSIKLFLKGLEFETGNKYKKCSKIFNETIITFNSEDDVVKKIEKVYENFIKNNFHNQYFSFENMCIRGEKSSKLHLEKGNCIEKEIKFIPYLKNEEYILNIENLIREKFHIIKAAPRIVFDLYYDTERDFLYKSKSSFRFRCRKKGSGWVACFKSNAIEDNGILSRDNVRTNMTVEDIVNKMVVGKTIQSVLKDTEERISEFNPSILIVQKRERFAVRPNNINKVISDENIKNITYLNQRSELVHIIFDEIEIYNAKDIELYPLLYSQEIVSKNYKCIRFKTAEIEANEREDIEFVSKNLFEMIAKYLEKQHVNKLNISKYELAKDLLNGKNSFTNF